MLSAPTSSTLSNPLRGKDKSNAASGLFFGRGRVVLQRLFIVNSLFRSDEDYYKKPKPIKH